MTTPEELVAASASQTGAVGQHIYFNKAALAAGKELGLDGFRFYVLGRGGVMGDVPASVITSAFGYFNPAIIDRIWNSGREKAKPTDAAAALQACVADLGRSVLGDAPDLGGYCDAAEQVIADVNPAGLPLYAGYAAAPLPDDVAARAMHLATVHRELRGSQHLLAVIASQLDVSVAHALRRPDDIESFGWSPDIEIPAGSDAKLAAADELTDRLNAGAYRHLSDTQRTAFVTGAAAIDAALTAG